MNYRIPRATCLDANYPMKNDPFMGVCAYVCVQMCVCVCVCGGWRSDIDQLASQDRGDTRKCAQQLRLQVLIDSNHGLKDVCMRSARRTLSQLSIISFFLQILFLIPLSIKQTKGKNKEQGFQRTTRGFLTE